MLRLDQLEKQRQGKSGSGHHSVGAARSLEALLGQHSALAIAGRNHDEQGLHHQQGSGGETASAVAAAAGGVGFARSSVSSSWSPPHLNTPLSARRGSSISSGIGTSIGIAIGGGSDGGGGGGGGGGALAGDGRGIGGETIGMTAASPWRSDPPTPRMPCLGGNGPWTPSEKESGAADADRHVPPCRALSAARMNGFLLFLYLFSCFLLIGVICFCSCSSPFCLLCRACALGLAILERFLRAKGMCFSQAGKS